ncbi:bestrophin family ion channel [soil metagenome]
MIIETNIRAVTVLLLIWKWLLFYLVLSVLVSIIYTYYEFDISLATAEVSMIGVALSILMGFRVNAAYERWWEARKIWGAVVNNSRSIGRQILGFIPTASGEDAAATMRIMYRQIAFVHAMGCRLRNQDCRSLIEDLLLEEELRQILAKGNVPNLLLLHNLREFKQWERKGRISPFELIRLENSLHLLTDNLGAAERIKNTPFPLPYSYFSWLLVHLFAFMVPFGMVDAFGYVTVPIAMAVIFIFLIVEQIALEIQDPFENRENDVPMNAICKNIEIDLKEMHGEKELPEKEVPLDGVLM